MYVVNDLHGDPTLVKQVADTIAKLPRGETLILNGDCIGSRGPVMNRIVKLYYEVIRDEALERDLFCAIADIIGKEPKIPPWWIYDTVHSGIFLKLVSNRYKKFRELALHEQFDVLEETLGPLSMAAESSGVSLIYLPGNGEIVLDDLSTKDITVERSVHPAERYYQILAKRGCFADYGVKYIPYAHLLAEDVALISVNLLDLEDWEFDYMLQSHGLVNRKISKVIVHYPPVLSPVHKAFPFWMPNNTDIRRQAALRKILELRLQLSERAKVYFGHVCLSTADSRMGSFPDTMNLSLSERPYRSIWVKPGTVLKI